MFSMQPPWWAWTEFQNDGRQYRARLDNDLQIIEAQIRIHAHNQKVPTWRRITHAATLQRLQAVLRPLPVCPTCGHTITPHKEKPHGQQ